MMIKMISKMCIKYTHGSLQCVHEKSIGFALIPDGLDNLLQGLLNLHMVHPNVDNQSQLADQQHQHDNGVLIKWGKSKVSLYYGLKKLRTHRGQGTGILANGTAASHEGHQEDDASKGQDDDGHAVGCEGLTDTREILYG